MARRKQVSPRHCVGPSKSAGPSKKVVSGTGAPRETMKYVKHRNAIHVDVFRRLIEETLPERFSVDTGAVEAIQRGSEMHLVSVFEEAARRASLDDRETIVPEDLP